MIRRSCRYLQLICLLGLAFLGYAAFSWDRAVSAPLVQESTPEPVPDRLAIPVLPEHPTQVDIGRSVYYYNCMPCHGDRGQGLTDEWRQVWVEDHQNCWGRGCHGGREQDQGFPIPRFIPAVAQLPHTLERFSGGEELFEYLLETHPPQRPGVLAEEEYWAVTRFLFSENGRALPQEAGNSGRLRNGLIALLAIPGLIGFLSLALIRQAKHS